MSGYVSILFGRSRASEDIDLFIEKIGRDKFKALWNSITKSFVCLATTRFEEAYGDYLLSGLALRFAKKGEFIPNIELKFPKISIDEWALKNRQEVRLNSHCLFISPLELQIAFKLKLGSIKDIEDARHLYNLFKNNLDIGILKAFMQKLKIDDKFKVIQS